MKKREQTKKLSISCPCLLLLGQRLVTENPTVTSSPAEVTSGRRYPKPGSGSSFGLQCSTDTRARAQGPALPVIFDVDGQLISETSPERDVDGVREQRARLLASL